MLKKDFIQMHENAIKSGKEILFLEQTIILPNGDEEIQKSKYSLEKYNYILENYNDNMELVRNPQVKIIKINFILETTAKERLIVEIDDLKIKCSKLQNFVNSDNFLKIKKEAQYLNTLQLHFMQGYLKVLEIKLKTWEEIQ